MTDYIADNVHNTKVLSLSVRTIILEDGDDIPSFNIKIQKYLSDTSVDESIL